MQANNASECASERRSDPQHGGTPRSTGPPATAGQLLGTASNCACPTHLATACTASSGSHTGTPLQRGGASSGQARGGWCSSAAACCHEPAAPQTQVLASAATSVSGTTTVTSQRRWNTNA